MVLKISSFITLLLRWFVFRITDFATLTSFPHFASGKPTTAFFIF